MSQPHALIIDDNAKNVHVIVRLLAEQNLTTTAITNPRLLDGVLIGIETLDVVFVDLEMPAVSGFDILKKLKADARFQHVPIVAYTVHVSEINVAHDAGFDSFIGKPLDFERFPEQLARILRGDSVWETA